MSQPKDHLRKRTRHGRSDLKTSFLSKTHYTAFIEDKILRHFAFYHNLIGSSRAKLLPVFDEKIEELKDQKGHFKGRIGLFL